MVTKSELASYNPIIEDTRSSAVAAITGVAPFSELIDGQRIVLHSKFLYTGAAAFTLNLTLSDGSTTGAKNIKYVSTSNTWSNCANTGISGKIQNGVYYQLYFDSAKNAWLMEQDSIQNLYTMTQAEINAGTVVQTRTISPKMLRDNFYLKSEVDGLIPDVSGKADKRVAVTKCDIEIYTGGSVFTAAELAAGLDTYYSDWRSDALLVAVYDNIVSNISNRTISGVTISDIAFKALASVGIDLDTEDKGGINPNNVYANPTLGVNTYNLLGTTDAPAPTLPTYDAADEFVFSFTCSTDACVLTLPNGVAWADGFDFESDRKAGAKVQVSIQDSIAGYLMVSPTT